MNPMRARVSLAAGVLALGIACAARADGGRGGGFPPPLQPLDPFSATPQALIERDFAYMRATSPNPSRFPTPLWARPSGPRTVSPPYYFTPSYPYGGSYYPYGYGYYGY